MEVEMFYNSLVIKSRFIDYAFLRLIKSGILGTITEYKGSPFNLLPVGLILQQD